MRQPPYLVQMQDADGFWCNVFEATSYPNAVRMAQHEANEAKQTIRLVCGPKRDDERFFMPRAVSVL